MDIDIQEEGLDQTHHVGNLKVCKEGKPSLTVIKFAPNDVRSTEYIYIKKKLKGKSFLITESLTTCVDLLKEAEGKYGVRNVWTTDDRILYKEKNRVILYKNQGY